MSARARARHATRPDHLAAACGPHSGFDPLAVTQQAYEHYELTRGAGPRWADLTEADRLGLAQQRAGHLLHVLAAPPPDDPRPVDHDAATSPPHPDGAAEVAHWVARRRRRLAELLEQGAATAATDEDLQRWIAHLHGPELEDPYLRGRVDESVRLLAHLHQRQADAAATGRDEVAHWIDALQDLAGAAEQAAAERPGQTAAGRRDELATALTAARQRQRNRAAPHQWRRGGAALLKLLAARGAGSRGWAVPDMALVIAAVDVAPGETAEQLLQQLTGESAETTAAAIARGVDRGVVQRTPTGATVATARGLAFYQILLAAIA